MFNEHVHSQFLPNDSINCLAMLAKMSEDEWVDSEEGREMVDFLLNSNAPRQYAKRPVQSVQPVNASKRSLDFDVCKLALKLVESLEERELYQKPAELMKAVQFLFTKVGTSPVWQQFKTYHANLLGYQLAGSVRLSETNVIYRDEMVRLCSNSLSKTEDPQNYITLVRECYKVIVHVMEHSVGAEVVGKYTQWVAKETISEMDNLSIVTSYLRERDESCTYSAPGKLPSV